MHQKLLRAFCFYLLIWSSASLRWLLLVSPLCRKSDWVQARQRSCPTVRTPPQAGCALTYPNALPSEAACPVQEKLRIQTCSYGSRGCPDRAPKLPVMNCYVPTRLDSQSHQRASGGITPLPTTSLTWRCLTSLGQGRRQSPAPLRSSDSKRKLWCVPWASHWQCHFQAPRPHHSPSGGDLQTLQPFSALQGATWTGKVFEPRKERKKQNWAHELALFLQLCVLNTLMFLRLHFFLWKAEGKTVVAGGGSGHDGSGSWRALSQQQDCVTVSTSVSRKCLFKGTYGKLQLSAKVYSLAVAERFSPMRKSNNRVCSNKGGVD